MTLKEKMAAKAAQSGSTVVSARPAPPDPEPGGIAATTLGKGRRLGFAEEGEFIPMNHAADPGWRKLAHTLETELCIVIGPGCKDEAFIGVLPTNGTAPLLIHKLKLVILPGSFEPF